jgi:SAM-dependent methyltransferase
MENEKEYILGTHEEEIMRLGLQHRVWRPRALDAWRRAGFTRGQTIVDLGCGPGYASVDLAEIVGPTGRVIAIDRSKRFLEHCARMQSRLGLENITRIETDLESGDPDIGEADGVWCRWIFAFVKSPEDLVKRMTKKIRPGGCIVLHEYFDYSTWRMAPRSPEIEEFVEVVMKSWRASGGEPDIGLLLPRWLKEEGFSITHLQPIIDIVPADNYVWQWPKAFITSNLARLVELGMLSEERSETMAGAFASCEKSPGTLLITPAVVEIIARNDQGSIKSAN